jgi:hypothetical protein
MILVSVDDHVVEPATMFERHVPARYWPQVPEILARSLEGVPDAEVNLITHENALRAFQLDAFAQRPRERCTVSALRAESPDVDLELRSQGGKPPTDNVRPVTTRDVTRQLASAFSEAPE